MTEARLRQIEAGTKIVSAVASLAVPVAVALVGWWINTAVQRQTVDRDYVQIAVSILTKRHVTPVLKTWATDVLAEKSPIPFGKELREKLEKGPITLPPVRFGAYSAVFTTRTAACEPSQTSPPANSTTMPGGPSPP